jgi:hypothetical protein
VRICELFFSCLHLLPFPGKVLPEVAPPAFPPEEGHAQEKAGQEEEVSRLHLLPGHLLGRTLKKGKALGRVQGPLQAPSATITASPSSPSGTRRLVVRSPCPRSSRPRPGKSPPPLLYPPPALTKARPLAA